MQPDIPFISRRTFVGLAAAAIARAQQDTTFSSDVKVVSFLASVRDRNGRIVNNLAKDDFDLSEDGRPQGIRYFSRETNLPLTLGLLVDTSGSQRAVLAEEKSASYRFVEHVVREDRDRAFVLHFDFEVELLQDVTSSRQLLEKAIGQADVSRQDQPQMQRDGGGGGGRRYPGGRDDGGGMRRMGGGTTLYDSILLASNEIMAKQKERKALILLSDGVDRGSKVSLNAAIDAAQRADTLVYSILFKNEESGFERALGGMGGVGRGMGRGQRGGGRFPQEQQTDGRKILQQISHETGGGFFEVSKKQTIDQIYDRIEEDLRNQYSIGYTSDKTDAGGFRKILLTTKQKGLTIQARAGYFAQ